jgi:hypothetical protein
MQITFHVAPPANYRTRQDYAALITALTTAAGAWIAIPLSDVPGTKNKNKQMTVIQAANQCGLKIETACRGDQIYIRLWPEIGHS